MRNRVETAWIMAEIEPYSFEPMRYSSQSEEDDVRGSQDELRRGNTSWCNASVVRTGKLRRNAYAARKSRKQLAKVQAPVVQRRDNAIHWINHYPADKF